MREIWGHAGEIYGRYRELAPGVVAHLRLEPAHLFGFGSGLGLGLGLGLGFGLGLAHLLALLGHQALDVGLEAAHRAVLDLLGLLGHPLLALGRLRLIRGDAGR